ncbi:MAG: hypothetical protein MPJ50_19295, partial [Pirellulales bacterium]|nr:hypothetical protein [Pirellulales bacterium]
MSPDEGSLQPICACMGHPVSGNPTQYMMERAFAHHDLDWRYLTLDVSPQNLQSAINGIRAFGFAGASVITPHKANVTAALDDLSESARLVEAVNCICRDGDRLIGENTEGAGFMRSLRGTLDPAGSSVLILGAGSTARAIGVELARAGCQQIQIVNRSRENGERLMNLLNEHFAPHPMEPAVPTSNDDAGEGPEKGTAGSATTGEPNKNLAIDTTDSAPPPADGARQQLATFAEWVQ